MSDQTGAAGASLKVVTHFRKSAMSLDLTNITQAGGREWAENWLLMQHRGGQPSAKDLRKGRFRLDIQLGGRQWDGDRWHLDIELGTLNRDTFEYEGNMTWALQEAADGHGDMIDRVKDRVRQHLQNNSDQQFTGKDLRALVDGKAQDIDSAAKALASDPAEPVRVEKGPRNAWLYRYDPDAVAALVGRSSNGSGPPARF